MREILFRGKRIDNGEWVEGAYCKRDTVKVCLSSDDPKSKHLIIVDGFCDWGFEPPLNAYEVDPATVGQFTGLTDKNGKKIFEGDIVRYGMIYDFECYLESLENPDAYDGEVCDHDIEVDVVEWCLGYDYPAFDLKKHQFECNGLSQIMCGDYEYEIIGNIHDNPELLEV